MSRSNWLIPWENPLVFTLGASFFSSLPEVPGVYCFEDSNKTLLYIGQSKSLKSRLSSYKYVHPDTHSRKLVRLVSLARKVQYTTCESPEAAELLENERIAEFSPKFNTQKSYPIGYHYLKIHWNSGNSFLTWEIHQKLPDPKPDCYYFGAFKSKRALASFLKAFLRLLLSLHKSGSYQSTLDQFPAYLRQKTSALPNPLRVDWPQFELSPKAFLLFLEGRSDHLLLHLMDKFQVVSEDLDAYEENESKIYGFYLSWLMDDLTQIRDFFTHNTQRNYQSRQLARIENSYVRSDCLNDVLTRFSWSQKLKS